MNFPFYIARRYLISKKSKNVINIISAVSIGGVCIGTMALIVVLSFFNGLDGFVRSLFSAFDPDIKVEIRNGKTFTPEEATLEKIKNIDGVLFYIEVLEENTLVEYGDKTEIATIKGVGNQFVEMSGIDSMIIVGDFILEDNDENYAVIGRELAYKLSICVNCIIPVMKVHIPKRISSNTLIPEISSEIISPSGIFSIQDEVDSKYIIVPIRFARELLKYNKEVSAIEIKISDDKNVKNIKEKISDIFGDNFIIKTQFEQHEDFFKIMKSEKWAVFLILTFILLVASFNIIGSLTMLIIDKKADIQIFNSMGAKRKTIRMIFLLEGWLISAIGAAGGIILGILICLCQQWFGFVRFPDSGTFIIDAYPVKIIFTDIIIIACLVFLIGFIAAWFPAQKFSKLSIQKKEKY
ncbi:ABC transporter permease [Bacteroidota bacterium]